MKVFYILLGAIAFCSSLTHATTIRTPAKRYGSAYSIKITLIREGVNYVVPVWVRPDRKESTLDPSLLSYMGWIYSDLKPEEVRLSGMSIDFKAFKAGKSEWALRPEYPKNCCYGVIGQDILKAYQLRFDPKPPAHIEWTTLPSEQEIEGKVVQGNQYEKALANLFSVKSTKSKIGKDTFDLSSTPYVVRVKDRLLKLEGEPSGMTKHKRGSPIVAFDISLGLVRKVSIISVKGPYAKQASLMGIKPGAELTKLNGTSVNLLSRFEIEEYLSGIYQDQVQIGLEKNNVIFDFNKNEFISTAPISNSPSRH